MATSGVVDGPKYTKKLLLQQFRTHDACKQIVKGLLQIGLQESAST